MRRTCSCGRTAPWSAYRVVDDGSDPRMSTYSLCLANCPACHSTLAERAGHVLASRHVARAVPKQVRLMTTEV
jgi:hypothetical protein